MRIVTPKRLTEFSRKHPQSRIPLLNWQEIVKKAKWKNLNDVKLDFNSVDYIGNNRYVFNIKGNDFRLIVIMILISSKIYVRFLGTHAEYDKIDAKTI